MGAFVIRQAETLADLDAVRALCWEYRDYLMNHSDEVRQAVSVFYGTTDYAAIMDTLHEKHARPTGVILLAEDDGKPVGCGMSQQLSATDAEIKRVFVREQARGAGLAQKLSRALVDQARADGYMRVFLNTSRLFTGAQALYEKLGFKRRGPYAELPDEYTRNLVFYELTL